MWKYTVHVEGMMCGMCESHVNDAVRKAFPVKKVTSSRSRNETTVIAETELDEDALRTAISATGYEVGEIRVYGGMVWPGEGACLFSLLLGIFPLPLKLAPFTLRPCSVCGAP